MKMPFERLMQLVARLSAADQELTPGELGERFEEPAGRVADAIAAVRVLHGGRTYVSIPETGQDGITVTYRDFWWE